MRPQQKHVAVSFLAISTHDLGANTSENLRRVAESQLLPPPIEGLMLLLLMPPLTPPPMHTYGVGSLLTFDIPQTALVATLDTYDFITCEGRDCKKSLVISLLEKCLHALSFCQLHYINSKISQIIHNSSIV
jgi:hypothetical protein